MKFLISFLIITTIFAVTVGQHKREDWWQNGNFYQIYPRSFRDSDGDGIGDLNGITEKLGYLKDIGMDGIWLSPIFKSPMDDFGYDISDYNDVQPEYGSLEDLERLIEEAHKLGLHILLDFVPNHSSDEHEWFQRSINGDPEYRDYYIWHNGVLNETTGNYDPPSNWISIFRQSAWEWNEKRQQYYLHQFGKKQPDLNYRNHAVRNAMDDVLRFWLSKGIDGFRIDAVPYFYEIDIDPNTGTYPNEPVIENEAECPNPDNWCHLQHIYTKDNPDNIETIYHWRELVDDWQRAHNTETKVLMTEAFTSYEDLMRLYSNGVRNGSHVPFNFLMIEGLNNRSTAADYKYYTDDWLSGLPEGAFANWVLGNHDTPRLSKRFGVQRIDLINIFLQTLPGIAVTFNGEEYGMEAVYVPWEETVDIQACTTDPNTFEKFTRDPERTPFRWDSSQNAGFSKANRTWLPVGSGYQKENVAAQLAADNSHLKIFMHLIELRKTERAFNDGSFESNVVDNVLVYKRQAETGDAFLVVLNVGDQNTVIRLNEAFDISGYRAQVEASSLQTKAKVRSAVDLQSEFLAEAYAGYVLRLKST